MGGEWNVYSDAKNSGGSSTVNPDPFVPQKDPGKGAKGTDTFAKVWGTVTTQYQYGFSGFGYNFTPDESTIDISGYTGVKFWMKGDGRQYNFMIKSPLAKDFAYYEWAVTAGPDWKEYVVPFKKFYQESWSAPVALSDYLKASEGIQLQTVGQPIDKFEFSLDEISLY
jgi:hypothetical protein